MDQEPRAVSSGLCRLGKALGTVWCCGPWWALCPEVPEVQGNTAGGRGGARSLPRWWLLVGLWIMGSPCALEPILCPLDLKGPGASPGPQRSGPSGHLHAIPSGAQFHPVPLSLLHVLLRRKTPAELQRPGAPGHSCPLPAEPPPSLGWAHGMRFRPGAGLGTTGISPWHTPGHLRGRGFQPGQLPVPKQGHWPPLCRMRGPGLRGVKQDRKTGQEVFPEVYFYSSCIYLYLSNKYVPVTKISAEGFQKLKQCI